ncbi:protein spinster isoform X2 [Bemisia tabaci]|uniref:protein spinster isoform X2 n=1 Tax=Bemisia tabaci TaxID=7038 RepID=UPI0008F9B9B9|nr:PREDICTED: protein spinster isoform X2 [Bemisia tabaci]
MNMEPGGIPPNNSHQHLMNSDDESVDIIVPNMSGLEREEKNDCDSRPEKRTTLDQWTTVIILCFVNLINYMDRYTIAGILTDVKDHYKIGDGESGLLQTAFVLSYMIFAPLFGYLGDRYSRRIIMAFGVFLWSLTTFLCSVSDNYYIFLMFRTFVGIGEASYSTIAPTIISDLFVKDMRSGMLALFYFAIPVGSGLGYIVGSETAKLMGSWQWGLRVTPVLGLAAVILILFFMVDPARGESEGKSHLSPTSWTQDISALVHNYSFMLSTAGFTCVAFVAGALAWWGPNFVFLGLKLQPGMENIELNDVTYKFGIITMIAGLLGVPLGSYIAQRLKPYYPRIDPYICAIGLLMSAPLLFFASVCAKSNITLCYIFIFFGQLFLNLNWSIVADILLYVVAPTRRSTAEALQILISHAFGDAGSPYLIGLLSEFFQKTLASSPALFGPLLVHISSSLTLSEKGTSDEVLFHSLQYALFTTSFVEVLGGLFFLLTGLYITADKKNADKELKGEDNPSIYLNSIFQVKTTL